MVGLVEEAGEEEGHRHGTEAPTHVCHEDHAEVSFREERKASAKSAKKQVGDDYNQLVCHVENELHEPVVAHLQTVNFHVLE